MTDTDLTDPHGEAEALRRENERLRRNDAILHDTIEKLLSGGAQQLARAEAAEAALAAVPAAPVAEALPVATIGGAELDALVERLRKLARDMERDAPYDWDEHEDVTAAADAITALRAQPDWKAMAERLGEVSARVPSALNSAFGAGIEEREGGSVRRQAKLMEPVDKLRDDIRAALSDLAALEPEGGE